jgi:hypothetical protein
MRVRTIANSYLALHPFPTMYSNTCHRVSIVAALFAATVCSAINLYITDFSTAAQAVLGESIDMAGTAASGVTASALTAGAGLNILRLDSQTLSASFASHSVGTNLSTTLEDAVLNNEYFEFTLTSTNPMQVTGFSFMMVKHGFTGLGAMTLRSDADGFAADLLTISDSGPATTVTAAVDLSSNLQLTALTAITFRLYAYDEYAGNNNRRLGVDDIVVSGVVVPEPRTIGLLLGISVLGAVLLRRRATLSTRH